MTVLYSRTDSNASVDQSTPLMDPIVSIVWRMMMMVFMAIDMMMVMICL